MTDDELEQLERKVDLLSRSLAELALSCFPEIDPLSPLGRSELARMRLVRSAPHVLRMLDLYLDPESTPSAQLARRQAELDRQRRTASVMDEREAEEMNRRLVRTRREVPA
jgi:hypothetical protein